MNHPGLSPRVRGNPLQHCAPADPAGSIPACAGQPTPKSSSRPLAMVYPRVCGATDFTDRFAHRRAGLSPRVRGNPNCGTSEDAVARSIPACAGQPARPCRPKCKGWVYPRVCGATRGVHGAQPLTQGLSPRVRGNPAGMRWQR